MEGDSNGSYSFGNGNKIKRRENIMKRFLGILVVSMFLGSAVHAQNTSEPKSRSETEDRKVGFEGEQKTGEKNKSDDKSGTVSKSRAGTEDRKVGFTGEQK